MNIKYLLLLLLFAPLSTFADNTDVTKFKNRGVIIGKLIAEDNAPLSYATVLLKGTQYGCITDEDGMFRLEVPVDNYTMIISAIGYESKEKSIQIERGSKLNLNITLKEDNITLDAVEIVASEVERVNHSAYNAVALDTREIANHSKSLSDALMKSPGVKIRESGGVGSDMQLMLDGFSGKHVRVFIDGLPQEGAGTAYNLNNIPINYAKRIEVYKGVVPVEFGSDALGGVVNI